MCILGAFIYDESNDEKKRVSEGPIDVFLPTKRREMLEKKNPTQILIFLPRSLNQGLASVRCFFF